MEEKRNDIAWIMAALGVMLVLLPVLYVGSYYMMLNPDEDPFSDEYRFATGSAKTVFAPISWLDRRMRPNYWRWSASSDLQHYGGGATTIEEPEVSANGCIAKPTN